MIDFRVLGAVDLRDTEGMAARAALERPPAVAVLCVLALHRPRGFQLRATLLSVLWPGVPEHDALAALHDAVDVLRRALGDDVVIGNPDEDVMLSSGVRCDALELERAVANGQVERAFELYRGPLFEGFAAVEMPGMDAWVRSERARLHALATSAAWSAALGQEARRELEGAERWARRAAGLNPDDEAEQARLDEFLTRLSGTGTETVAAWVAGSAADAGPAEPESDEATASEPALPGAEPKLPGRETPGGETPGGETPASETPGGETPASAPDATSRPVVMASPPPRTIELRAWHIAVAAVMLLALVGGIWQVTRPVSDRGGARLVRVEIAGFELTDAAEPGSLAIGVQEMLALRLASAGVQTVVVPARVDARAGAGAPAAAQAATTFALRGSATITIDGVRAEATLHDGAGRASGSVNASGDLASVVDGLAAGLLRRLARGSEGVALAELATHSPEALRHYVDGRAHFRDSRLNLAITEYRRATSADSTFALAHYALAAAYLWAGDPQVSAAVALASRYAERLPPTHARATLALQQFVRGYIDDAEQNYRATLSAHTFDAEAWFALGEILFHYNPQRGRSVAEARAAYERALELGPRDAPLRRLIELAGITRDYTAFDTLAAQLEGGTAAEFRARAVLVLRGGTQAQRNALLAGMNALSALDAGELARSSTTLIAERQALTPMLRRLSEPRQSRELRALAHILTAHTEAAAGRIRAAEQELARAASLDAGRTLEQRAFLYALPFLPVGNARVAATHSSLSTWNPSARRTPGPLFAGDDAFRAVLRTYHLGLLNARLGQTIAAERYARETETMRGTTGAAALSADLARGVRARVAYERGDHAAVLALLEATRLHAAPAGAPGVLPMRSLPHERYLRAEALHALGRREEALGWYASFTEASPYSRVFLAPAHLRQAEIHEELGNPDVAAFHYARFIELWQDADPGLRPRVADARRRLERVRRTAGR